MRATEAILEEINLFKPTDDNWLKLEELLEELWKTGQPQKGIETMFRLFERFPEEDGQGVFWSIVHGLESLNGYELELLNSIERQPTMFGIIMVDRIANSKQKAIGKIPIDTVYYFIQKHPKLTDNLRSITDRDQK